MDKCFIWPPLCPLALLLMFPLQTEAILWSQSSHTEEDKGKQINAVLILKCCREKALLVPGCLFGEMVRRCHDVTTAALDSVAVSNSNR